MIAIRALLAPLSRPDVTELRLLSGRKAAVRVGGARLDEIGAQAFSADDILGLLFSAGGSRYVETLGPKPAQWRTRIEGVGMVSVTAMQNGAVIEATFTLRDAVATAGATAGGSPTPPIRPLPAQAAAPPLQPRPSAAAPLAPARPAAAPPRPPPLPPRPPPPAPPRGEPARAPHAVGGGSTSAPTPPMPPRQYEDDDDDDNGRPSVMPTPPRGFQVPREALPSLLDLDVEFSGLIPPPPPPPPPPPRAPIKVTPKSGLAMPAAAPAGRARADSPSPAKPVTMGGDPPNPPARPAMAPAVGRSTSSPVVRVVEEVTPPPAPLLAGRMTPPMRASTPPAGPSLPPERRVGRITKQFEREAHALLFRTLLREAREAVASDLHLVAGRPALLRVAGRVEPTGEPLEPRVVEDMGLTRMPRRLVEVFDRDGSCDFSLEEPGLGRYRVNLARQRTGMKISLRLVLPEIPTLASLGLPEAIAAATHHHQGLIVLTGPTGHGKTATLAAVVDFLNAGSSRHVITVEDPIEHVHPRKQALLSQREVGTHTKSFAAALKASLREDPDVIVIGELRDAETVRIALTAAETGHLVMGTMSTPSAARAIDRLIDLFPPADHGQVRTTLAGALRLIVGQRLLPDVEGRAMVAAAELLPGMVPLWNLIRDGRTYQIPSLQQRGKELGVVRLDDSLRDLVRAGRTTAQNAVAVAEAPEELELALGLRRPSAGATPAVRAGAAGAAPPRAPAPAQPPPPEPSSKGIFDFFKKG